MSSTRAAVLACLALTGCASTPRAPEGVSALPAAAAPRDAGAPSAAAGPPPAVPEASAATQSPAPTAPPATASPTDDPAERVGRLARVRLLRAFRIAEDDARLYGAPGGLGFEFLAVRPAGVKGLFTIRELRDAKLSGKSYRDITRQALGGVYEPQSVIDDPEDMRVAGGRTVAEAFPTQDGDARVMRTLLYGVRIHGVGPVVVVAEMGFGDTELFEFTLPLESLELEPASH